MYSNIFINIFFLKCRYQEKTELFIKEFIEKYKKEMTNEIINQIKKSNL